MYFCLDFDHNYENAVRIAIVLYYIIEDNPGSVGVNKMSSEEKNLSKPSPSATKDDLPSTFNTSYTIIYLGTTYAHADSNTKILEMEMKVLPTGVWTQNSGTGDSAAPRVVVDIKPSCRVVTEVGNPKKQGMQTTESVHSSFRFGPPFSPGGGASSAGLELTENTQTSASWAVSLKVQSLTRRKYRCTYVIKSH